SAAQTFEMAPRRLTSPEGRNRMRLYARMTVAACPDDRASCPATASAPSERIHALSRLVAFPVGEEADPRLNRDPPLNHRAPEGGFCRLPDAWVPRVVPWRQQHFKRPVHACNTELTNNCV